MDDINELELREQFSEVLNAVLELGVTYRAVELDRNKWKKEAENSAKHFEHRDNEVFDTTARAIKAEEDRDFWKENARCLEEYQDFHLQRADNAEEERDRLIEQKKEAEEDRDFWKGAAVEETDS